MRLAILEPLGITAEQAEALRRKYLPVEVEMTYYNTLAANDEEKKSRLLAADCAMLANSPLSAEVMKSNPALRFLSVAFTGVDHVDMAYCHDEEILVSNCAGYANEAVSELALGLAIGLYRRICACDEAVRNGGTRAGLMGMELSGKKFGIVGTGAIGLATARLAQAFGCEIYAYSRTKKDIPSIKFVSLEELLSTVDILSLHVPLSVQTKGLIGKAELKLMKKTAVLINTARGPVVEAAALADALKNGELAGAALDVFDQEPPVAKDNPLLEAPNTLLAPHVGFATQEALVKRAEIAFQNVAAWLEGKPQNVM